MSDQELSSTQIQWNPSTNITFELLNLHVWPEKSGLNHVVGLVEWVVQFERNGCVSRGHVETLLPEPDPNSFVNIDQVSEIKVIGWALQKEGGENFLRRMEYLHEPHLRSAEQRIGLVPWVLNGS